MTTVDGKPQTATARSQVVKIVLLTLLIGWFLLEVYPVLFLFFTSFKTDAGIVNEPFAIPFRPIFDNYATVWEGKRAGMPFWRFIGNSLLVTGGTLVAILALSSLAGYSLARGSFPGNATLQEFLLLAMAVPVHALVIPTFFLMRRLALANSLLGLMLVYMSMGLPFTILLMRAYFLSFPIELEEAARVDGCSRLGALWRVVIPVSRNAMVTTALINVPWIWSELLFAMALLGRMTKRTLPLAVVTYTPEAMTGEINIIGPQFAAMTLATAPLIIFYFFFQREITKGMTMGAFR